MAAKTFSQVGAGFPDVIRFTTSATPDLLQEVTIKKGTKVISVQFISTPGKLAFTGTDGSAIGTDYISVPGDSIVEFKVAAGAVSIFVASATASQVVEVTVEQVGR